MQLVQHVGGKLSVFNWGRPNVGKGILEDRLEQFPVQDAERLHDLQIAKTRKIEDYYMRAVEATKFQLSIDLYQFAGQEFCDLSILRELCLFNGGDAHFYPNFDGDAHGLQVYSDLRRSLTRETAWEAVMRIRCSSGHMIRNYIGSFHRRSRDLLAIPVIHADTVVAFDIQVK